MKEYSRIAHERQIEFHGREMVAEDRIPPQQAEIHRQQRELHLDAIHLAALAIDKAMQPAEVVQLPISTPVPEVRAA